MQHTSHKRPRPVTLPVADAATVALGSNELVAGGMVFSKLGMTGSSSGSYYSIAPSDLRVRHCLGKGCCSRVFLAEHRGGVAAAAGGGAAGGAARPPSLVALKQINVLDDARKREQMLTEIKALYSATCDTIVKFYGAFYREGAITIMLEYVTLPRHCSLLRSPS